MKPSPGPLETESGMPAKRLRRNPHGRIPNGAARPGASSTEMNDANCIFCRIVRGQAEASLVYEDDVVVAFLDSHPVTEGHTLVVPRRHAPDLAALDQDSGAGLMAAARLVALALRTGPQAAQGVNLHLADGAAAGQTVGHTHVHVIPRYAGDGFGFRIPFGGRPTPDRRSLDDTAARLKQALPASSPS